ncbi:hypothetical protein [Bifidobacterium bifidum]|uniref:hypothetical protein n=1 Tax=Bifidobacterium bifidum TaxID=1681 RepID=UPI00319E1040
MKKQTSKERKRDERKSKSAARPTRHARIMRGVVTPILGLLAVACIGLGIMNATYWKPSSQIAASAAVKGTQYIVTDPGVLPLVDNQVTVSADAGSSDGEVCLALGSNKDVIGWLARQPYVRVTGLNEWTTLATTKVSAQGAAADAGDDAVAFKDSDMWTSVTCGTGTVKAETKVASDSGTVAIIDLGKSSNATVHMNWVRQTLPDFAMPFYFAGGLLALLAVLAASLFAMPPHKRRKRVVSGSAAEKQAEEVAVSQAVAGSVASLKAAVSFKPKSKRRRHAAHRGKPGAGAPTKPEISQPKVVDPGSRNLVADQQNAQAMDQPDDSATSVITASELQTYFARLSQESDDDTKGSSNE